MKPRTKSNEQNVYCNFLIFGGCIVFLLGLIPHPISEFSQTVRPSSQSNSPICTIVLVASNETVLFLTICGTSNLVKRCKIRANGRSLDPHSGPVAFDGSWAGATELMLESRRWSHFSIGCRVWCGAERWWPLASGPARCPTHQIVGYDCYGLVFGCTSASLPIISPNV